MKIIDSCKYCKIGRNRKVVIMDMIKQIWFNEILKALPVEVEKKISSTENKKYIQTILDNYCFGKNTSPHKKGICLKSSLLSAMGYTRSMFLAGKTFSEDIQENNLLIVLMILKIITDSRIDGEIIKDIQQNIGDYRDFFEEALEQDIYCSEKSLSNLRCSPITLNKLKELNCIDINEKEYVKIKEFVIVE